MISLKQVYTISVTTTQYPQKENLGFCKVPLRKVVDAFETWEECKNALKYYHNYKKPKGDVWVELRGEKLTVLEEYHYNENGVVLMRVSRQGQFCEKAILPE